MFDRHRILRQNQTIRDLVQENEISVKKLITPLFIVEGENKKEEISSMPNYYRMSLDMTIKKVESLMKKGLKSFILFVKVSDNLKDNTGKEAINPKGLMQNSIKALKKNFPEIVIFSDVALDPYSSYGHDGIVVKNNIDNDLTIEVLGKMALSHAEAGVDFVAPSDMMDGRILEIKTKLRKNGYVNTGILSYSAKYASCFYGPFRDALDSAPGFGDKKTYQMDYSNSEEAIRETLSDIAEGANMVMVKPALPYLDIITKLKAVVKVPVVAYQVSGEYAMIKAAAEKGWVNEKLAILETLTAIKRAGADVIISYFGEEIAMFND